MAFLLQEGGGKPMTMAQLLARGEEAVDRQFADDPALRTRMLLTLADLYGQDKDEGRADALLKRARGGGQRHLGSGPAIATRLHPRRAARRRNRLRARHALVRPRHRAHARRGRARSCRARRVPAQPGPGRVAARRRQRSPGRRAGLAGRVRRAAARPAHGLPAGPSGPGRGERPARTRSARRRRLSAGRRRDDASGSRPQRDRARLARRFAGIFRGPASGGAPSRYTGAA